MKRKTMIIGAVIFILLVAGFLFYFSYLESPSRQILAQVNGEKITVEQFNKDLEKVESPLKEMFKEDPQPFLENMIVQRLLLQEARKQGLTAPVRTYKDTAKDFKSPEDTLIEDLIKKKFSTPPTVTKEEIKTVYSQLSDRLAGKSLDQVASDIEALIRESKRQEEIKQFIADLRSNASVEIDQIRLKKIATKPPESDTDEDLKKALTSGKPILVDFGSNSCVPCRQMRPILKEISKEYSGKTEILVIDVYKYQNLAREYKVLLIPTLVFFDSKGKEVFRHVGALDKEKIVAKLKEIGMAT